MCGVSLGNLGLLLVFSGRRGAGWLVTDRVSDQAKEASLPGSFLAVTDSQLDEKVAHVNPCRQAVDHETLCNLGIRAATCHECPDFTLPNRQILPGKNRKSSGPSQSKTVGRGIARIPKHL